jgi:hypothetical protein
MDGSFNQVIIAYVALPWLFNELYAHQIADDAVQMLWEVQELAQIDGLENLSKSIHKDIIVSFHIRLHCIHEVLQKGVWCHCGMFDKC